MRSYSFAWPFQMLGVVGLVFLVIGLFGDTTRFDKAGGPVVFTLVGLVLSVALFAVNDLRIQDGTYVIRKGFVFWHKRLVGSSENLKCVVVSDNDGGYLLYLLDGATRVMQLASSPGRASLEAKADEIAERLALTSSLKSSL